MGVIRVNFDESAKQWDNERRMTRAKLIAAEIKSTLKGKGGRALEFGCGTGLLSFLLRDEFDHITLLDASQGMIDQVMNKIEAGNLSDRMTAICADILRGDKIEGNFDFIFTSMAMHHVKDTERALTEFYHLLKDGGTLCIVDLDEDGGAFHRLEPDFDGHNGFDQQALSKELAQAGFSEIKSKAFYRGKKNVGGEAVDYSLFIMVAKKEATTGCQNG